jgi:hypothetical protein
MFDHLRNVLYLIFSTNDRKVVLWEVWEYNKMCDVPEQHPAPLPVPQGDGGVADQWKQWRGQDDR